jgi:hypothetical protein
VRLSIVGHQTDSAAVSGNLTGNTSPGGEAPGAEVATEQSPGLIQQAPPTPSASSSVPYTYSELDWSSPHWTPVVIRADPCATLTAAKLLRDKVEHLDDVVMDVPLGRAKHAAVVGRRGFVLASLSADTNVRIMVPRRELRHDVIQLEGELDKVKLCLERVLVIVGDTANSKKKNSTSNTNTNINNGARQQQPKKQEQEKGDGGASAIITVPVLPSQTKLRTVAKKTVTVIKKKKKHDESWDLTISGSSQENVQSATAILKKWSEENASTHVGNSNNPGDASNASSGTPSRPRGRGRQQGRNNNNKSKGNRNKNGKSTETS